MAPSVEQAWALPVDVATLGAHLTAYIAMRQTIETLRLCNRFGRGDRGITTLPTELVAHVELHLLEDKRRPEREVWTAAQRCMEKRCEPLEHLDDHGVHEMYHRLQRYGLLEFPLEDKLCVARDEHRHSPYNDKDHFEDDFEEYRGLCNELEPEPHSKEHVANQRIKAKAYVSQLMLSGMSTYFDIEDHLEDNGEVCRVREWAWRWRTGADYGEVLGLQGTLSSALQDGFGLNVRVTRGPWDQHHPGHYPGLSVDRPTSAYLHLPTAQGRGNLAASPAQTARFARAISVLGLEVVAGAVEMDTAGERSSQNGASHTKDISKSQQPGVVTFSKYADHSRTAEFLVWESDFRMHPDRYEEDLFEDFEDWWNWAVVKN